MPEHMRAVVQQAFGGPDVLEVAEVDGLSRLMTSSSRTGLSGPAIVCRTEPR